MPDRWGRPTMNDWMGVASTFSHISKNNMAMADRREAKAKEEKFSKGYNLYREGKPLEGFTPEEQDAIKSKAIEYDSQNEEVATKAADRHLGRAREKLQNGNLREAVLNVSRAANTSSSPVNIEVADAKKYLDDLKSKAGEGVYNQIIQEHPGLKVAADTGYKGLMITEVDNATGQQKFMPLTKQTAQQIFDESYAYRHSEMAKQDWDTRNKYNQASYENAKVVQDENGNKFRTWVERLTGGRIRVGKEDANGKITYTNSRDMNASTIQSAKEQAEIKLLEAKTQNQNRQNQGGKGAAKPLTEAQKNKAAQDEAKLMVEYQANKSDPAVFNAINQLRQSQGKPPLVINAEEGGLLGGDIYTAEPAQGQYPSMGSEVPVIQPPVLKQKGQQPNKVPPGYRPASMEETLAQMAKMGKLNDPDTVLEFERLYEMTPQQAMAQMEGGGGAANKQGGQQPSPASPVKPASQMPVMGKPPKQRSILNSPSPGVDLGAAIAGIPAAVAKTPEGMAKINQAVMNLGRGAWEAYKEYLVNPTDKALQAFMEAAKPNMAMTGQGQQTSTVQPTMMASVQ